MSRLLAYYNETILLFLVGLLTQTLMENPVSQAPSFLCSGCPERLNCPTYSNSHGLRDHNFYYLNMFIGFVDVSYLQYYVLYMKKTH